MQMHGLKKMANFDTHLLPVIPTALQLPACCEAYLPRVFMFVHSLFALCNLTGRERPNFDAEPAQSDMQYFPRVSQCKDCTVFVDSCVNGQKFGQIL